MVIPGGRQACQVDQTVGGFGSANGRVDRRVGHAGVLPDCRSLNLSWQLLLRGTPPGRPGVVIRRRWSGLGRAGRCVGGRRWPSRPRGG